jgi:hypothetical protein
MFVAVLHCFLFTYLVARRLHTRYYNPIKALDMSPFSSRHRYFTWTILVIIVSGTLSQWISANSQTWSMLQRTIFVDVLVRLAVANGFSLIPR